MHKEDWDDLRYVLAVAESGTVSGAAKRLGVNHATVLRRIAAFEARVGGHVFDRTGNGYKVPPDREKVIDAAREVEAAVVGVTRAVEGAKAQLSGVVRLTSTDTFCISILPPILAELAREEPELQLDLQCTNTHLDMSRLHADVAVRPSIRLADDHIGDCIGDLTFAPYRSARTTEPLPWLGLGGMLANSLVASWMADEGIVAGRAAAADSFLVLRELAALGLGQTYLPVSICKGDPRLVHAPELGPVLRVPVWVMSHNDVAGVSRFAAVRARLAQMLKVNASISAEP